MTDLALASLAEQLTGPSSRVGPVEAIAWPNYQGWITCVACPPARSGWCSRSGAGVAATARGGTRRAPVRAARAPAPPSSAPTTAAMSSMRFPWSATSCRPRRHRATAPPPSSTAAGRRCTASPGLYPLRRLHPHTGFLVSWNCDGKVLYMDPVCRANLIKYTDEFIIWEKKVGTFDYCAFAEYSTIGLLYIYAWFKVARRAVIFCIVPAYAWKFY